ncbi:hypothetical protein M427DRAFT_135220 [Gonapodya prolifera JEL478]|uniref:Protein HRI1 n=1 Tax=Gonapodya prolifera (strain JEL478) TaxID=1344416 RepID=A0A139AEN9_GONPJ|nr:hypothetical protein M427DRAFT_135220 [Gonapodya prolifera JEL478]|eukprot:KXS15261.1 hypothetical protein M427DRAFT_135220 [Gonapodya prolifera JEL478]
MPHPLDATVAALPRTKPYINTRRGIAWGNPPAPFSEPCDVLILHGSKLAADVRINKTAGDIDWAMVVWSEYLEKNPPKKQFHHIIDSRGQTDPDCGVMHTLPNETVLETGEMTNPATGTVQYYEELWHDIDNTCPKGLGLDYVLVLRTPDWKRFVFKTGQYAVAIADQSPPSSSSSAGAAAAAKSAVPDFAVATFELSPPTSSTTPSNPPTPSSYTWHQKVRRGITPASRPDELAPPPVILPESWVEGAVVDEGEWKGWLVEDVVREGAW